ncbi:MAG: hypothetical protein RJA44_2756 [Pseudomonadota bacterium]
MPVVTPGWIDVLLLVVLIASMLLGLWRGVAYEVLSLFGWLLAWLLAQAWGPDVALRLPLGSPGSALRLGAGFLATFVGVLVLWRLITWLVQQLLQASPLAPLDRALGAGFGLLRGLLIVLLVVQLGSLTPLARSGSWRDAQGVQLSRAVLGVLVPLLPASWAAVLSA